MTYDAEKIVADYLRAETGARVVASPPNDRDTEWVQLVEITRTQDENSRSNWLTEHYLQLDCYAGKDPGGGVPNANDLGERVWQAMTDLTGVQDGVVVTKTKVQSHRDWDVSMTPVRHRRVVTAAVYIHP